jgi:hypothetical protein
MKSKLELKYLTIKKEVEDFKNEILIKHPSAFFADGTILNAEITKNDQEYFERIVSERDRLYRELQNENTDRIS